MTNKEKLFNNDDAVALQLIYPHYQGDECLGYLTPSGNIFRTNKYGNDEKAYYAALAHTIEWLKSEVI